MIPQGARVHRSVIRRAEATGGVPSNQPSDYLIED